MLFRSFRGQLTEPVEQGHGIPSAGDGAKNKGASGEHIPFFTKSGSQFHKTPLKFFLILFLSRKRMDTEKNHSSSNRISTVLKVVYSGTHRRGTFPVSPWRFFATIHSAMFLFSDSSL